jgi:LysM repeat protein
MLKSRAIKLISVPLIAGAAVFVSGASAFADSVVVQPGDTLSGIAATRGLTWQDLESLNQLPNPNLIFPGQIIQIPTGATSPVSSISSAPSVSSTPVQSTVNVPDPASSINWDAVAQCESSGDWQIDTGNGFYGGLQFTESTWLAYGGGKYASYANEASKAEQETVANAVLAGQGIGAWPVCGPRGE